MLPTAQGTPTPSGLATAIDRVHPDVQAESVASFSSLSDHERMGPHETEFLHFVRPGDRDRVRSLTDATSTSDAAVWDAISSSLDSRYRSWLPEDADVAQILSEITPGDDGCRGHAHVFSSASDVDQTDASIEEAARLVIAHRPNRSVISCLPGRVAYFRDDVAGGHAFLLRPERPDEPPSPDEARQAIADAFSEFELKRKIGAYEAWAIDDYGSQEEIEEARRQDLPYSSLHWSDLPRDYVVDAGNVMPFFDDESLCAFVPAFLTFLLDTTFGSHWDRDSGMAEWIEYRFFETRKGRLLTSTQRAAVLKYLEFEVACEEYERSEYSFGEPESPRLLKMWKDLMTACRDEID